GGDSYVVDFFTVQGGAKQDYVFHGPNLNFEPRKIHPTPTSDSLYDFEKVRGANGDSIWSITWKLPGNMNFTAWSLGQSGERVMIGNGWGQRDYRNSDVG